MKKRSLVTVTVLLLGLFCFTSFGLAAEGTSEGLQPITKNIIIKKMEALEPTNLTSKPGTTVVWINASEFPVEIIFVGKKVVLTCGTQVDFSPDQDGALHSSEIPEGGTASLCFREKGEYTYKVLSSRTLLLTYGKQERKESKGTIFIK
jgi:plastocyanin